MSLSGDMSCVGVDRSRSITVFCCSVRPMFSVMCGLSCSLFMVVGCSHFYVVFVFYSRHLYFYLRELREEFEAIVTKTKQTRDRVDSVQAAAREDKRTVTNLKDQLERLPEKMTDMEDRSRRNNVRLVGLPEGMEGPDAAGFLRANLSKWIPSLRGRDIEIEKTVERRIGGPFKFCNSTPLWHNFNFVCGNRPFVQPSWSSLGVNTCGDMYDNQGLCSFQALRAKFCLPASAYFVFLQLRSALKAYGVPWSSSISSHPMRDWIAPSAVRPSVSLTC